MTRLANHRVLIVNDDGIHAPGIRLLEKAVREHCDDVWVVAPDEEKSGASHSVSMHVPIRLRQLDDRHIAIKGSPTDCVLMALREIMQELPTLVLAGINRGGNLADEIHYSGTIAVAMEAALMGIPSIALSQVFERGADVPWDTSERYIVPVVEQILERGIAAGSFVNINFPPVTPDAVSGVQVVSMGRRPPGAFKTEGRVDNRQIPYYWVHLEPDAGGDADGTDLRAMADGAISVCPLQVDMTNRAMFAALSGMTLNRD
ncbi:MAG: 5'/3'-nucleotidase SurE [Halieaceae bacterium]|jgi:5'-nucleotidase|uniref:5'/3'-nucleotidase SurE n=1 Tax=Haliea alexandrii TaxID=2448162 RepID=UPI000F0B5A46|nr:5'/3'-nucleotidase SurE [Haliea alexandrii]MCR9185865.1 5'/3'-nucleotidase SurE [Halieaceae bacterium]